MPASSKQTVAPMCMLGPPLSELHFACRSVLRVSNTDSSLHNVSADHNDVGGNVLHLSNCGIDYLDNITASFNTANGSIMMQSDVNFWWVTCGSTQRNESLVDPHSAMG
jgi:hypothetical protein